MRHARALVALLAFLAVLSCQQQKTSPVPEAVVADARSAFVILPSLPLSTLAGSTLTQMETIPIGEKLALLGQAEKISQGGRDREIIHVRRPSGSDGWVRSDGVVSRSILSVVTTDNAVIYSMPHNTAATTSTIPRLTIVAVASDTGGMSFIRVTGYDATAKVVHRGVYLRNEGVSSKEEDVQPAILLQLAAGSKNLKQQQAFLASAIKDYPGSIFLSDLKDALDALTAPKPAPPTQAPVPDQPAPAQQPGAATPAAPAQSTSPAPSAPVAPTATPAAPTGSTPAPAAAVPTP